MGKKLSSKSVDTSHHIFVELLVSPNLQMAKNFSKKTKRCVSCDRASQPVNIKCCDSMCDASATAHAFAENSS